MNFDNLLLERDGAVAVLSINRPRVLNALNSQTISELRDAVVMLTQDDAVRAVVLTGTGEKAFVAGADIAELRALGPIDASDYAARGQEVFDRIEQMGKPVIAAVNGYALGGGCELAMACTLRVAADTATFGQPEVDLGLMPGYGGTQRLPRLVGRGVALDMLLTGRRITADEALSVGLVNRVVPPAELMGESRRMAAVLASKPRASVRSILEAVRAGSDVTFDDAQSREAALFGLCASTDDMREGTTAFLEKRVARFSGA
jgi:enoyl-CoA hydratase